MLINDDTRESAIEYVNSIVSDAVEYETTHIDAGNNYSHMPAESWDSERERALSEFCKEQGIDTFWIEPDILSNLALEHFRMFSGHIFGMKCRHPESEYFILDSYHVQECEIWIDLKADLMIDAEMIDAIERDCDCVFGVVNSDHVLAYQTTDAVWYAAIHKSTLRTAIADYAGESEE